MSNLLIVTIILLFAAGSIMFVLVRLSLINLPWGLANSKKGVPSLKSNFYLPIKLSKDILTTASLGYCWISKARSEENVLSSITTDNHVWGSYRPDIYFGLKTISASQSVSTGIMWGKDEGSRQFRHQTSQDELEKFEWDFHNGKNFGEEIMVDRENHVIVNASFIYLPSSVVTSLDKKAPTWIQRIQLKKLFTMNSNNIKKKINFAFYFGIESLNGREYDVTGFRTITPGDQTFVVGYSKVSGYFAIHYRVFDNADVSNSKSTASATINLIKTKDVADGITYIVDPSKLSRQHQYDDEEEENDDNDSHSKNSNFFSLEFSTSEDERLVEITYFDHLAVSNMKDLETLVTSKLVTSVYSVSDVDNLLIQKKAELNDRFENTFNLQKLEFSEGEVSVAKKAFSSLLGGIGYFFGKPRISDAADIDNDGKQINQLNSEANRVREELNQKRLHQRLNSHREYVALLTATPSRTSFPRGFLWDEGFHQMLVVPWNPRLTMNILTSWLNNLHYFSTSLLSQYNIRVDSAGNDPYLGGWIPREMILGEEATKRVPDEFVSQRANIANPPTLFLVFEHLLNKIVELQKIDCSSPAMKASKQCADVKYGVYDRVGVNDLLEFFQKSYKPLSDWLNWYVISQAGSSTSQPGSFRWRGRSFQEHKLVSNTLASGLDDYPRSPMPTAEEYHLDLYCWITKAAIILGKVQTVLNITATTHPENFADYNDIGSTMLSQLDTLHWSADDHAYLDYGLYDLANTGIILESAVRCQNPESEKTVDVYVPIAFNKQALPTESMCPADYPLLTFHHKGDDGKAMTRQRLFYKREEMTNQLIPHVGYNNLYPFLLQLISPTSSQLSDILSMIESPDIFWTEYGLRSISAADMFYWKENGPGDRPYWRGPIWINMNYLALQALNHYRNIKGPEQSRCDSIYKELRKNVIALITSEYEKTGQFWEQYDDTKGAGMRGHPFTGWTSLLVNIMSEMY